MHFNRFVFAAVLILGATAGVSAQSAQPAPRPTGTTGLSAETPVPVSGIDVNRLPVDMQRLERRFRQSQIREEHEGLNLRYYVDVFAQAPRIVLFTQEDNLRYGPVPYGAPTHQEMLDMITPRQFRHIGGINLLSPKSSKK